MPHDPTISDALTHWAADLLTRIPHPASVVRVSVAGRGLTCVVQVGPSGGTGGREQCRCDVLAVLVASGRPLTRKEVVRELRAAGTPHGPGTVAKALAELTTSGALVNPKDKRGYRLPAWIMPSPSLFADAG